MDYSPLSLVNDEIRLLEIEPFRGPDTKIRCRLTQTPLGSAQNYIALSYRWGDPNIRRGIVVSEKPVSVTASLETALQELRQRDYLRVWADALCINQDSPEERSQQVLRMTAIYRSASKVVTFLTCECEEEASTMSGLYPRLLSEEEKLERAKQQYRQRGKEAENNLTTIKHIRNMVLGLRIVTRPQEPRATVKVNPRERDALISLFYNQYWRRAWIMQEVTTNPSLEIIWGQEVFELPILVRLSRVAVEFKILQNTTQLRYLWDIDRIRTAQLSMRPPSILEILPLARDTLATEARDRLYAILGLTSNGNILVPFPSYTLPDAAVNRDITIRVMRITRSLDFLLFKRDGIGSWYPNWFDRDTFSSRRIHTLARVSSNGTSSEGFYNACNNQPAEFEIEEEFITVRGFFVDEITACSPTLPEARKMNFTEPQLDHIKRYRDRVPWVGSTRRASRQLRWLLDRIELWDSSGRISYASGDNGAGLPFALYEKNAVEEPTKSLVQWLCCCSKLSFKIRGYHIASWFMQKNKRDLKSKRNTFLKRVKRNLEWLMRLGVTATGRLGWFNKNSMPGDKIAIILGCRYPAILRKCEDRGYCVVGEAILKGLMQGQAMKEGRQVNIKIISAS